MFLEHFLLKYKMKYCIPDLLFCQVLYKVSSNPKSGSINKWRFFISAFNIHPQISLILLNVVFFYNLYKNFADKCLKVKLMIMIDICIVLYRIIKKNAQVCIYSLADLKIGYCVELTFLGTSCVDFLC